MNAVVRLDVEDPTPPYEQLRRQLATAIATGALSPGERLPPVRQLARDLSVAAGTVARSYRLLEEAGLVSTRRGGGTTVSPSATRTAPDSDRLGILTSSYLAQTRALGATKSTIISEVTRQLQTQN